MFQPSGKGLQTIALKPLLGASTAGYARLNAAYPKPISWSLDQSGAVLAMPVLCVWISWESERRLERALLPVALQGEFAFEVGLPVGTPIERPSAILAQVESAIVANQEDIQKLIVTFGFDATNMRRSDEGEHSARFKVVLATNNDQTATEE